MPSAAHCLTPDPQHQRSPRPLLNDLAVADTAPSDLRGTAFGFFNLVSGVAMLLASVLAGLIWDRLGAAFTFYAGATFSALALAGLLLRPRRSASDRA